MSPGDSSGSKAAIVSPTNAAGTINQMCRGAVSASTTSLRGARTTCAFGFHRRDCCLVEVVGHTLVTGELQPANHVGAHAAQPDHRDLHAYKVPSRIP